MTIVYDSHPYGLLNYTNPSAKMTRGPDGLYKFRPHNLYLNSAAPANQSITLIAGATYRTVITGSVSMTASGAATGVWTVGQYDFTAATPTLTLANTSGAGTVTVYRTPCEHFYLASTSTARYALPFEWDASGNLIGIVREPAATNLVYPSVPQASAAGAWVNPTNMTITTGQADPFGGTSAVKVEVTATASTVVRVPVVATSTTMTGWVIGKKGSGAGHMNAFAFYNNTAAALIYQVNIDWDAFTASGVVGTGTTTFTDLGNGWVLVELTVSTGITVGNTISFYPGATGLSEGAGEYSIIAHVQVEAGAKATSPIITHTAWASRAEDQISVNTSLLPPISTAYAMYLEGELLSTSTTFPRLLSLEETSDDDRAALFVDTSRRLKAYAKDDGVAQADFSSGVAPAVGATFRLAGAWATNSFRVSANGAAIVSDVSGSLPVEFEKVMLGTVGSHFRIKKARVYYRDLTDTELVNLSTSGALS